MKSSGFFPIVGRAVHAWEGSTEAPKLSLFMFGSVTHLLRLDPVMSDTYRQVQAFCRMVRQRYSDDFDAWITDVQQSGVKELRAFAKGLLKDAAAVRAGLSRIWSNGPTEGFIHRLKRLKRQASGRAGVDCLRHRILASSAGVAV